MGISEARKARSTTLGSLIHAALECYLRGGTVYDIVRGGRLAIDPKLREELSAWSESDLLELAREASKRALAGLHYLPDIRDPALEAIEVERWIDLDTARIAPDIERLRIPGKIDLTFKRAGKWYLFDHKSTRGRPRDPWVYCKTPAELRKDPQGIFYGLGVMHRHGLESVWARWTYFLTDPKSHPDAHVVDVELHRAALEASAVPWLQLANEMRGWVRRVLAGERIHPEDLPAPPVLPPAEEAACYQFGGCPYGIAKGGPCCPVPNPSLGEMICAGVLPAISVTKKESPIMSLATTLAQVTGQPAPQSLLIPPEASSAPAAPTIPPGFESVGGVIRPQAPPGWWYNTSGTLEPVPTQPAAWQAQAPAVAAPVATATTPPPRSPRPRSAGRKAKEEASPDEDRLAGMATLLSTLRDNGVTHAEFTVEGALVSVTFGDD